MRGDGRIFLRGSVYWAAFMVDGKEHRETTGQTDEQKAQKYLDERTRASKNDRDGLATFVSAPALRKTCADLLENVKTDLKSRNRLSAPNLSNIKATIAAFGTIRASRLRKPDVDKYIIEREAAGDKPATINRRLQMLRRALSLAVEGGELARVPKFKLCDESGNVREGWFEAADFYRVHSHLPEYLKPFCEFFYLVGMRPKEMKSLRWADVEGDTITLRKENTKSKKNARVLPMRSPKLAAILATCKAARPLKNADGTLQMKQSEFIFHRGGRPIGDYRKSWANACTAAGVQRFLYDCRRTFARNQRDAGVPREVIKKIAGWRTDSMFERYNIIDTADVAAAFAKVEGVAVAQ